ncbi:MAG: acyl carrier protein [Kiritimatiellaceae bacterium]|nr:acyl carrier protein [Kiritimatiellaceae bacterium]
MEKINEELKTRIADILSIEADGLSMDVPLHTLGLDSMRMVELLVFIETHYGIDLMASGMQREDIASITALARSIERMKNA